MGQAWECRADAPKPCEQGWPLAGHLAAQLPGLAGAPRRTGPHPAAARRSLRGAGRPCMASGTHTHCASSCTLLCPPSAVPPTTCWTCRCACGEASGDASWGQGCGAGAQPAQPASPESCTALACAVPGSRHTAGSPARASAQPCFRAAPAVQAAVARLFPLYMQPLRDGRQLQAPSLYGRIKSEVQQCIQSLQLGAGLQQQRGQQEAAAPAAACGGDGTAGQRRACSAGLAFELPYVSKFLLLAAYVASRNKPTADRAVFDPGLRRRGRRDAQATDRQVRGRGGRRLLLQQPCARAGACAARPEEEGCRHGREGGAQAIEAASKAQRCTLAVLRPIAASAIPRVSPPPGSPSSPLFAGGGCGGSPAAGPTHLPAGTPAAHLLGYLCAPRGRRGGGGLAGRC